MTARWTCSYAYDCTHYWRWSAVVCQQLRRWRRIVGLHG